MFVRRSIAFFPLALLLAAPAFAQGQEAPTEPVHRYVAGFGGGATVDSRMIPTLAGEYGEVVTPKVFAFVNYAYFDDLMTDEMRNNLVLASNDFAAKTGIVRQFSGRDRGLALTFGAKVMPWEGTLRPYVGGGAGVLHRRRTIREETLGDVTTVFLTESPFNDDEVNAATHGGMKPLAKGIFGVAIMAKRAYIDVSYAYHWTYHGAELNFPQFGVSVGATF